MDNTWVEVENLMKTGPSEGQFVQDSNKVYQKVAKGAERAVLAEAVC